VTSEHDRPCTTYITQVHLFGKWFGNMSVQIRSYLKAYLEGQKDTDFGMRLDADAPWQSIETIAVDKQMIASSEMEVSLSKSLWYPKKLVLHANKGTPMVGGMFQVDIRNLHGKEAAKMIFRQDLPDQEHLNLAVRRISALGRMDVGGLIGFDSHARSLETPSADCNHYRAVNKAHRIASQDEKEGYTYRPLWKERWDKIRHDRQMKHSGHNHGDNSEDNEAAASLFSTDVGNRAENMFSTMTDNRMCKCPAEDNPSAAFQENGVIVEATIGKWGDASWD